jgi:hypothetical protein
VPSEASEVTPVKDTISEAKTVMAKPPGSLAALSQRALNQDVFVATVANFSGYQRTYQLRRSWF